ncbi:uncharacterized protein ISCGN_030902 [Ixodes scapularis]
MSFYEKHIRPRKATTNVKAPPVGDTAQCLLMEMVESSPDDSTIPTDLEPAQEELQCSPEAPVPATPSTSGESTSSTSRRSSGQSQRCPGPPPPPLILHAEGRLTQWRENF